ncbi:MAG: hypothetical protein RL095_3365 [Verrucomicrobiota bacterium]|jgi:hypothetical protein
MKTLLFLLLGASLSLSAAETVPEPWGDWQKRLEAEAVPETALAERFREFRKSLPETPENRLRAWNLGVELAVKSTDAQLDQELFAEGAKLAPKLGSLPRPEAWRHLILRLSQSRRFVCAHSTRRDDLYEARGRQAWVEFLAFCTGSLAAGRELDDTELTQFSQCCDHLAAMAPYIGFEVDEDPAFASCRKALVDPAFASRLLRLALDLRGDFGAERQAEARRLEAELRRGQAKGSDARRREWLALVALLEIPPETLAAEVEPRLGSDARQHALWAWILARRGPGSAAVLQEKMRAWAGAAPNDAGRLIFLVYLNQLESLEGPEIHAEDWLQELCGQAWEALRLAPASPRLSAARSALVRCRFLGRRPLATWIAATDPCRDFDFSGLPRELDSPLSLLRLQAEAEIPAALLRQVDRDLDPERGAPLERSWLPGELAELATGLEAAAAKASPGSARWCRTWIQVIRLRQAFERGDEVTLDLGDPWLWRQIQGSSRIGGDGALYAATLCGQRYLRMSHLALPPPFQAEVEIRPDFTQSEIHLPGESFFGLVCGDPLTSPYSGRILFSDARFDAVGVTASQASFIEGRRRPERRSWVQKALVWPDGAEVHIESDRFGYSSRDETLDSNEATFRPGALGFATPLGQHRRCSHYGMVVFRQLKFRRLAVSDAALRQEGGVGREVRLALSCNRINLRLCLDSALAEGRWKRALELLELIGTRDFPAGTQRLDSTRALVEEAALADERARAEEGLKDWSAAARSRRRALALNPADDFASSLRRRCALIRCLALAGDKQELPALAQGLELALEHRSPELRAAARRALAWSAWAEGRRDEAELHLSLADKLAPGENGDAGLMRHKP